MTFVVAFFIFGILYQLLFFIPLGLLILVLDLILPEDGFSSYPAVQFILAVPIGVAFLVAGRRAYLAAQAYGCRDMTLLQAHEAAGAAMRAELSFLPLVGRIFGGDKGDE